MGKPKKRAGMLWRLLAHHRPPGQRMSGDSYSVTSDSRFGHLDGRRDVPDEVLEFDGKTYHRRTKELEDYEFDELVVDRWLHIEQMDTGTWWMNVGGVTLWVRADGDGNPTSVTVYEAGGYADKVDGCEYGYSPAPD